jgi:hypothetical protein
MMNIPTMQAAPPIIFLSERSRVQDTGNGLRFHFENQPGLLTDLARVIEQEQNCAASSGSGS